MSEYAKGVSDEAYRHADLSVSELWIRYFELGGMGTLADVESYLDGAVVTDDHDHDLLAHALNERFSELGSDAHVEYARPEAASVAATPYALAHEVRLEILGSFGLHRDGVPVRLPMNAQRLLCFLALHDGSLLRQHVAGSLWGETTDAHAAGSLRSALWRLGHATDPVLEVAGSHLRLLPDVVVDYHASELVARRILDRSQDLSDAELDDSLFAADLLPDWTEDWVLVKREYYTQLRLRALETLCLRLSEMGRHGQAVQAGVLAVLGEPLRESGQRALMTAHLADGNVAAATTQYHQFRELLLDEVGVEPSPEMRRLLPANNR